MTALAFHSQRHLLIACRAIATLVFFRHGSEAAADDSRILNPRVAKGEQAGCRQRLIDLLFCFHIFPFAVA